MSEMIANVQPIFLCLALLCFLTPGSGQAQTSRAFEYKKSSQTTYRPKGACGSIDIRNNVKNLERITNCTVIEGSLHILLIDYAEPEQYLEYSFPDLVEITDHLLLYRVKGMKSLRNLFPNLAVIRGQELFNDFALIVYEMQELVNLGLVSLTSIPRGAVRLESNPELCYIETIDWGRIATGVPLEENFFRKNKDIKECVNRCPEHCVTTMGYDKIVPRCWTIDDCQSMLSCPENCESGFCNGTICCNNNCLGGCRGPSHKDCTACKDVIQYGPNDEHICAARCSSGTYKFKDRRCILDTECTNFSDYNLGEQLKLVTSSDISFPGECVLECPAGYQEEPNDKSRCVVCRGKCPNICVGKIVDSITSSQELKSCTIVTGPLVINIMGGSSVGQELEDNLSQIEEVTDYIRIYHSYALLSLHFFKSLKIIRGEKKYQNRYSLVLFDNLNLQELFLDSVVKNLQLPNTTVLFQYNRKLCYNKINTFLTETGLSVEKEDISRDTNGDQMPCEIKKLKFGVVKLTPHIAILKWDNFNITDIRHLISYTINYKEAPEKNVSIYQGRDACSDDLWKTVEVQPDSNENATVIHNFITGLRPWTQYAAYIQTLTISKADQGAISDVIYFRTAAEVPTSPTNLQVKAKDPKELYITWDPPNEPNGNVTHYEVYWQLRDLNISEYELRDYCNNPLTLAISHRSQNREDEDEKNITSSEFCCQCPPSVKQIALKERESNMAIQFQDFLQNEVYLKRLDRPATTLQPGRNNRTGKRNKRDNFGSNPHEVNKYTYDPSGAGNPSMKLTTAPTTNITTTTTGEVKFKKNITKMRSEHPYFKALVYEVLELYILNLGHFQDYNIEVIACQERDPRDPQADLLCSNRALGLGRTMANEKADTINASFITVTTPQNKSGAVMIKWEDPPHPNGLIVTYEIEYMHSNIQNVKPSVICITYKKYRDEGKGGYMLDKLEPGNYTFRIRATSLAGNGSWTESMFFNIEDKFKDDLSQGVVIGIVCAVLFLVIILTGVAVWVIAKKRFGSKHPDGVFSQNPDYVLDYGVYEPDEWEVDRDKVELLKELGQGSFGMVYEGLVKNLVSGVNDFPIAVKTTNNNSNDHDRYMFLQEASIMKAFHCHHVVRLMGVVSKGQPALVLMELMAKGDLKNFLRMHRPDEEDNDGRTPPTLKQILQISGEITDGMAYLADKKYVHRDLAARNCMVGEDMTVKIGDFGMTRDIYETDYYRKGNRGLLPVRWMAPESLKDGVFTSMSDVWSFGVVLWEMATLAAQPYQGLANEEVLRYVGSGKIMDTPERCPPKLYDLMVKCWRYRPKQRPTFKEIIEILLPDLDKKFMEVSYFFSEENAKYEEAKQIAAANNHVGANLEEIDDDEEDEHAHCPMNDYVDEANLPMLGVGASNGHSVELQDIFTDNGSYPHFSNSHKHVGSAEVCDCTSFREVDEGAAAQSMEFHRQSVCSSPNSAIGGSSDGSKDSSKSSSSSYAHMNGLSVANGHVPVHVRTTPC